MGLFDAVFYLFAIVIIASAIVVVLSKNIMYSAFSLLFTFFGVAGLYVLLSADFLAITQIMIYIGGILILIIFGVMLTSKVTSVDIKTGFAGKIQLGLISILTVLTTIILIVMATNTDWHQAGAPVVISTIKPIGVTLLTDYLIAFEAVSVLLLIAIIGAALIARRNK
jgi:NADH-quinone oxidoreductase subunit J